MLQLVNYMYSIKFVSSMTEVNIAIFIESIIIMMYIGVGPKSRKNEL